MKKLCSYRGLMGFIYALVMLLPFSAIALRCAYVTFNKNAYQSYSAQNVEVKSSTLQINENSTYYYNWFDNTSGQTNNTTALIEIDYCSIELDTGVEYIRFTNSNSIMEYDLNQSYIGTISNINNCTFSVSQSITLASQPWFKIYLLLQEKAPLDNAFDYSLYTFLNENGTGKLNLTNWFVDIFLNETTHNLLYINYINWYMNYSLLVSCVYILYLVLMWFLTLARRLLTSFDEKGSLKL